MAGYFYTDEELIVWRDRSVNGPFKTFGADYTNSPGDWDRMVGESASWFANFANSTVWSGPTSTVNVADPDHPWRHPESRRSMDMLTASFVDLVNNTSVYTSAIKNVLLQQAQVTNTNFTNRTIYPKETWTGDENTIWSFAEWQMKFLKAYDFIGEENFTASEQTIMRNWFAGGADWHNYLLNTLRWPKIYETRTGDPTNYLFTSRGEDLYNPPYRYASSNALNRQSAGSWKNNRSVIQTLYVTACGLLFGNSNYKQQGAWCTKEYIAYHWFPDGYAFELYRSTPDLPQKGIGYIPSTLAGYLEIAKFLYEDGYENLFEWSTTTGLNINTQQIDPDVGVTKSLEWCTLNFRNNFLLSSAQGIYPYGSSGTSTEILMHYCNAAAGTSQLRHRTKPCEPAVLANIYYNNPQIREIYWPDGGDGNLCPIVSNPNPNGTFGAWNGTGGMFPAFMFMYADYIYSSEPTPPDPTPSTGVVTRRFRRSSL